LAKSGKHRRVALTGIGVSPGVAIGHVHLVDRRRVKYPRRHVPAEAVDLEVERLVRAVEEATAALNALKERAEADQAAEESSTILGAHLLMMQDPMLLDAAKREITGDRKCAEWALKSAVRQIRQRFDQMGHAYFRERRSDVDFVGERILASLMKDATPPLNEVPDDAIIVAHDVSPADVLTLLKKSVTAIVTEGGGKTSHTAILARALEIPAVVGCPDVLQLAGRDDVIVVDGGSGEVILHPSKQVLSRYRGIAKKRALLAEELMAQAEADAITPDGHSVDVLANIDLEEEVGSALAHGARGVGLYRTEFLFMKKEGLPSVEEHTRAYAYVLGAMGSRRRVILRTFDLGSDKLSQHLNLQREDNPALGLRACRLGLVHHDLFRAQLRGMLLATSHGHGAIMFPMIGGLDEFLEVRGMLEREMDLLEETGTKVWREVPVGVMIELPSAVWVAEHLAEACDFFSIGTNDLIQYAVAIDRGNELLAHLYHPLHPGVLRAIQHVVDAGHAAGIPVGMCGEMCADPVNTAICVALGVDSMSMPLSSIPRVKWAVRRFTKSDADALLASALAQHRTSQIEKLVKHAMHDVLPELVELPPESDLTPN
jgi:phosphotransferase system enzyme I (PtsI)